MALKIIFAGSPDFAAHHLKVLLNSEHEVVAVYSQPDRPAGRGRKMTASPVKAVALEQGVPVYQPEHFKSQAALATLESIEADIMVVVAYGLILPEPVLRHPRLGCINVHASELPRWRGAAPIQRALLAGDTRSGVTIMQMDKGLDTGDMLVKRLCDIDAHTTGASLHDQLMALGGSALLEALQQLEQGCATPQPQDNALATYAAKLSKQEGRLNWHESAKTLDLQIRALTPWPGSYTYWQGQMVRIHKAQWLDNQSSQTPGHFIDVGIDRLIVSTGQGALSIQSLQLPGKKAMDIQSVLNARRAQFLAHPQFDLEEAL